MPVGNLGRGGQVGARATYQPFPPPPAEIWNADPIQDGIYKYSSSGFSIMGCLPKRPSELLSIMTEQHELPEVNRFGQERRGGPGKKKGKSFFHAHLTWYGIEYHQDDSRDELEDRLWNALTTLPPPALDPALYPLEAEMRQRWIEATAVEQTRVVQQLTERGYTADNSELLAGLTGGYALTEAFFTNPDGFLRTHFAANVSRQCVVVLSSVDTNAELEVWEWACDVHHLRVEKVDNNRGRGRMRGRFPDFVIGRDAGAVRAKANEIRQANGQAGGVRYNPY